MIPTNTSRLPREALRVSSTDHPGWEPTGGRVPSVGDYVFCLDGPAEVTQILGRTSDGSRLLELRCPDRRQPFFASSGNVLVRTGSQDTPPTEGSSETGRTG